MRNYIVDANPLLRYFLDDIPEQKRAFEELLHDAKKSKVILFIPQIVIFEIHFILNKYYNFDKKEIITILESLVSVRYIKIESKIIFISALTIYKSTNISFTDCFLVAVSKIEKANLFTFDKKLQKML